MDVAPYSEDTLVEQTAADNLEGQLYCLNLAS